MSKKSDSELTTASVLAFERKLANSDGLMFAGDWHKRSLWQPISIKQKDVRGTISNRLKAGIKSDPAKLDAEIEKPNLQRVDVASLPFGFDTLRVNFSLKVLGGLSTPCACNDQSYAAALGKVVTNYLEEKGCRELSKRYAMNLANARFLWRNRLGAQNIEVKVTHVIGSSSPKTWIFNSREFNLFNFDSNSEKIAELAAVINQGLSGNSFEFFQVESFVQLGEGQEVFPSQELVLDKDDKAPSKVLYQVDHVAAMHSQKIGNAIRTIDSWYGDLGTSEPIAVEPYGSVTSKGKAYRQPKDKLDFYSLLDRWVLKGESPAENQQHFVIATLIRGGVFGEKGE